MMEDHMGLSLARPWRMTTGGGAGLEVVGSPGWEVRWREGVPREIS